MREMRFHFCTDLGYGREESHEIVVGTGVTCEAPPVSSTFDVRGSVAASIGQCDDFYQSIANLLRIERVRLIEKLAGSNDEN